MDRTKTRIGKRLNHYKATAAAVTKRAKVDAPKVDKSWDYRLPEQYQAR